MVSKKVSDSVSKIFGIGKVSDSVSEKFGIGKKFWIRFRSDFGYRHTLDDDDDDDDDDEKYCMPSEEKDLQIDSGTEPPCEAFPPKFHLKQKNILRFELFEKLSITATFLAQSRVLVL